MKKGWASAGGNRWEVGNIGDHNTKWAGGGFENKGCWTKCLMPRAGSKYLPATSFYFSNLFIGRRGRRERQRWSRRWARCGGKDQSEWGIPENFETFGECGGLSIWTYHDIS